MQIAVGIGAFVALSLAVGLLLGRAMRPTTRMHAKPNNQPKGGRK